ncbi:MAG: hypothetical protein AAB640_01565 [Patescibacteria group bacterium]
MVSASLYAKKPIIFLITILIAIGFFVYFFNLNNPLFWDDDDWIIRNNFVHTISWDNIKFWLTHNTLAGVGMESNYYRPFLFFTFALNYIISGIKPFSYHLFNNLIHIANGLLIFILVYKIFKKKLFVFLASLIFLIHPLQTEAITYVSGRGDALVTFFMLLALLFFYKAENNSLDGTSIKKIFSLIFLVLGLLSRETAIIFPFLALVFYISFISKERFLKSVKQGLIKTWPYFLAVLVYGLLRLTVLNFQNTLNFYATPNLYSENLHYRLFTFMHVLVDYFKLLFVPTGLHMERSMTVHTSLFQWPVWLGALIIFGILGMLYWLYKNRHPDFKIWLFGWGVFFIALGPVSGITPINALIYEHWLYLPMVGFWLIASFYVVKLLDCQSATFLKIQGRTLVIVALIAYFLFFYYKSIQGNILMLNQIEFY